jgi:hypothetical protein
MKRKGSTTSIVIATIAGLSVLGVAGYRMMSGDCSACAVTGTEAAVVQTVAAEGDSCCALKAGASTDATLVSTEAKGDVIGGCETGMSCESACSGEVAQGQAQVEMISTTAGEAEKADACGEACAGDACGKDADACCGKCEAGKELAKAPQ